MQFTDQDSETQIKIISQIVHKLPVGIVVINNKFQICAANEKVCKVSGYSAHELYGESVNMLLDQNSKMQERHIEHLKAWFSHPQVLPLDRRGQLWLRTFDGKLMPVKITVFPLEHWMGEKMVQLGEVKKPVIFGSASIVFNE